MNQKTLKFLLSRLAGNIPAVLLMQQIYYAAFGKFRFASPPPFIITIRRRCWDALVSADEHRSAGFYARTFDSHSTLNGDRGILKGVVNSDISVLDLIDLSRRFYVIAHEMLPTKL